MNGWCSWYYGIICRNPMDLMDVMGLGDFLNLPFADDFCSKWPLACKTFFLPSYLHPQVRSVPSSPAVGELSARAKETNASWFGEAWHGSWNIHTASVMVRRWDPYPKILLMFNLGLAPSLAPCCEGDLIWYPQLLIQAPASMHIGWLWTTWSFLNGAYERITEYLVSTMYKRVVSSSITAEHHPCGKKLLKSCL